MKPHEPIEFKPPLKSRITQTGDDLIGDSRFCALGRDPLLERGMPLLSTLAGCSKTEIEPKFRSVRFQHSG